MLDSDAIHVAQKYRCTCEHNCMDRFSIDAIASIRSSYLWLGGEHDEQARWLADVVSQSGEDKLRLGVHPTVYDVCKAAFVRCIGISQHKLEAAIANQAANKYFFMQDAPRDDPKTRSVKAWLENYRVFECKLTKSGCDHLPEMFSWKEVYELYLRAQPDSHSAASKPEFMAVRRHHFPKLHKHKESKWQGCPKCADLKYKQHDAKAISPFELLKVRAMRAAHVKLMQDQRTVNDVLDRRAQNEPYSFAMIYVDQTFSVSFPRERPEVLPRKRRIQTLQGGTISVSTGTAAVYISLFHDKGPNLMLTQVYLNLRELMTACSVAANARELHLHGDLTFSENRNLYMIGTLGLFIHHAWFSVATFSSLLEYHGGCKIDSTLFRALNTRFDRKTLHTPADIMREAALAFTSEVDSLENTGGKRAWAEPVWMLGQLDWKKLLHSTTNSFPNISHYRAFRIEKGNMLATLPSHSHCSPGLVCRRHGRNCCFLQGICKRYSLE
jgi:hypothetical protein